MSLEKRPNFLIIVADDLGFTDVSAFGGEIHTPNLKKLGTNGIRFTDFHTALACSPTRSMLFSGTDNHIAGLGQMREFAVKHPKKFSGKPGYEGYLNERVAPLPEILHDDGYYTFISGKWHLGLEPDSWPVKRGFEKAWTLLPGAGNHFKYIPRDENGGQMNFTPWLYADNDREVDCDKEIPEDFYSTNYFTDKGIEFLTDDVQRQGRPFFGCLTYTAPHWPYQAHREKINKYKGKYDAGPEYLRQKRLKQAIGAGILPDGIEPHQLTTYQDKRWHQLSDEERAVSSRIMETYAAMVEILDDNIGRVIDVLEKKGELDNTFVLFMSDNGAEGLLMEALPLKVVNVKNEIAKYYHNELENIGNKDSWTFYGDQWAQAATAPSYMCKGWNSEGGIRCPLILHYPPLHDAKKKQYIARAFTTVMDILPTVLELAEVQHPGTEYKGRKVVLPKGKSWIPYLQDKAEQIHSEDHVTGWELFGQQAVRKGPYKALFIPKPFGPAKWQLFHIRNDPGETKDLAEVEAERLQTMLNHWAEYVAETGLVELGSDFLFDDDDEGGHVVNFTYVD